MAGCAGNHAVLSPMREKAMTEAEWRALQRKHHICPSCGKQDAYTLAGRTMCAECAERERLRAEKRRETAGDILRHRQAEIRRKRAEEGKCTRCGRNTDGVHKLCLECRLQTARMKRERMHRKGSMTWEQRVSGFVCFYCGGEPMEGRKICEECYKKRCGYLGVKV